MISFEPTQKQVKLQKKFRTLAKETIQPYALQMDRNSPGPIDKFFLKMIASEGLNKYIIPREYGGEQLDWVTLSLITEEIGYGCAGYHNRTGSKSAGYSGK